MKDTSHILQQAVKNKGWDTCFFEPASLTWGLWRRNADGKEEVKKFTSKKEFNDYLGLI